MNQSALNFGQDIHDHKISDEFMGQIGVDLLELSALELEKMPYLILFKRMNEWIFTARRKQWSFWAHLRVMQCKMIKLKYYEKL